MIPTSSRTVMSTILGAGVVFGLGTPVLASTPVIPSNYMSYNITHGFTINVGGNLTPLVRGYDWGQALAFSPYGTPTFVGNSYGVNNYTFPTIGSRTDSATATTGLASANASSTTNITALGIGTVSGSINASGTASALERGERACANSLTGLSVSRRSRVFGGSITWAPRFSSTVSGSGCAIRKDPIKFTITDPDTGKILNSGQFLDITNTGDGSVTWGEAALEFAMNNGSFSIDLNSSFIPENQRGTLLLKVQQGTITDSQDSGIFDGYLPGVGTSGTFSISGGNFKPDLGFNYDLGEFPNDVDLTLTADGGGVAVPEPLTILGTGVVLGAIPVLKKEYAKKKKKKDGDA